MPNLTPDKGIDIHEELSNLSLYKYHPGGIMQVSLNRLQAMLEGKVLITEPSNPFVYLLETSCLNTAFAVQEFTLLSRKLYPRLANKEEDLYLHMSDYDFLGRFAEPSYANVMFNILFNDFESKAYYDAANKVHILKIPRHLKVIVGGYVYLMTSAIIIRRTENGVIDVKFENQDYNNLFPISVNYINFVVKRVNQNETYLSFALKMPEVDVEVVDTSIDITTVCKGELMYNNSRQFYYFRAFYMKDDEWVEMLVTHTNEVYDILKPTCVIKVLSNEHKVQYHIPAVYITSKMVGLRLKFLTYTTRGKIAVNFGDFQVGDFTTEYGEVFPGEELDKYTQPLQNITKVIYTADNVDAGKDGMTFDDLKSAVINNSIGDRALPITPKQLEYYAEKKNFRIIKDVDVVTNRIYKLETVIPYPLTRYPVTRFNLDMLEFKTTVSDLREGNAVTSYGDDVTVIPQGTLFELSDGKLQHLSKPLADNLKALSDVELVSEVNSRTYLSTYYHYVLSTANDQTTLRAYDLTAAKVASVTFKEFNSSARIGVNTITTNFFRTPTGYGLDVMTNLKKYTETIDQTNLTLYLVYKSGTSWFYLPGGLYAAVNGNPVYRFSLESVYHITPDNQIEISNFIDTNGQITSVKLDLLHQLDLIYTSNIIPNGYEQSDMDELITSSYLSGTRCVVTLEEVTIQFGIYLQRLYSGVHTSVGDNKYQVYTQDVPMRYTQRVYDTGLNVLHEVGDIVYDESGNVVYAHRQGDTILDSGLSAVPISELEVAKYLNLLFIDYRVLLATSKTSKDHETQIRSHITEVVTENAVQVQNELLDNTEAFVTVPKRIGPTKVSTVTNVYTIPSMQSFTVDVYVSYDVFNNALIRENIEYLIVKEIDEYFYDNTRIKKTELLNSIYVKLKEFIVSVSIPHFTELNEEYLELSDDNSRISLAKSLVLQADGYELKEDIQVNFKPVK